MSHVEGKEDWASGSRSYSAAQVTARRWERIEARVTRKIFLLYFIVGLRIGPLNYWALPFVLAMMGPSTGIGETSFGLLSLPWRSKNSYPCPLIDEIPIEDQGPFPSLVQSLQLSVALRR
jgi:hypothetical protein